MHLTLQILVLILPVNPAPAVLWQASLEEQTDDHEPETVPTDLVLDFGPGLSAAAPAASAAASPTAEMDDTNMVQKKRKIREAEAQPILPDMEGTSAQQVWQSSQRRPPSILAGAGRHLPVCCQIHTICMSLDSSSKSTLLFCFMLGFWAVMRQSSRSSMTAFVLISEPETRCSCPARQNAPCLALCSPMYSVHAFGLYQ